MINLILVLSSRRTPSNILVLTVPQVVADQKQFAVWAKLQETVTVIRPVLLAAYATLICE